jgi:hypothetical protein
MPIREEMQSLAHDIVRSYEDRAAGVAELRERAKEVRERAKTDLKEFRASWAAMGKELRADLAKSVADRKDEVGTMLKSFDVELNELNRTRGAMSKELKADLSRSVAGLKGDVASMVKGFDETHAAISRQMKADLAKDVANRKKGVAECKRDVDIMLQGFGAELKEVRSALAGAQYEWQKLTATMQARRGGPVAVAPPPVEEVAEKAVPRAEVAEETTEIVALQDRVFAYLANHPDGRKLVELEQEFGVARIQMARVLRILMDENKIDKREGLYFAI